MTADPNPAVEAFVLDTSAIVAFFGNQPGADRVTQILDDAASGRCRVYLSFAAPYEIAYKTRAAALADRRTQVERDRLARARLADLSALPAEIVPEGEAIRWIASGFKARGGSSALGAFTIALARASLVRWRTCSQRDPP